MTSRGKGPGVPGPRCALLVVALGVRHLLGGEKLHHRVHGDRGAIADALQGVGQVIEGGASRLPVVGVIAQLRGMVIICAARARRRSIYRVMVAVWTIRLAPYRPGW